METLTFNMIWPNVHWSGVEALTENNTLALCFL